MWSLEVEDLHNAYENLLFFTIPKLLHVHRQMSEGNMEGIMDQISFLFKNNIIVREKLKTNIKVLLLMCVCVCGHTTLSVICTGYSIGHAHTCIYLLLEQNCTCMYSESINMA